MFQSLGQHVKAREYLEKALAIEIETGDRDGGALRYENTGKLFQSFGQYDKAREYPEKALAIKIEQQQQQQHLFKHDKKFSKS